MASPTDIAESETYTTANPESADETQAAQLAEETQLYAGETAIVSGEMINSDTVASVGDVSASTPPGFMEACTEGGGTTMLLVYAALFGLLYLFMIRPQQKRRKKEEAMRRSVEIGDEVTTIGGICGRVVSIKEDETLVIETGGDRAKIKIKAWAIGSNETIKDEPKAEEEGGGFFGKLFKK